jgi:hypothetical protein
LLPRLPRAANRENPQKQSIFVVPVERIELPTFGLQNRCSTAELNRLRKPSRYPSISKGIYDLRSGQKGGARRQIAELLGGGYSRVFPYGNRDLPRPTTLKRDPAIGRPRLLMAFPSEVKTGSREENGAKTKYKSWF